MPIDNLDMPGFTEIDPTTGLIDEANTKSKKKRYDLGKPFISLYEEELQVSPINLTAEDLYAGTEKSIYDDTLKYTQTLDKDGLAKHRHEEQPWYASLGAAGLQTATTLVGQTMEGIGYLLDGEQWVNMAKGVEKEYNNWFSQIGKDLQEAGREIAPIYTDPDKEGGVNLGDWTYWMSNLPSIASTLSFFIPATGVVKAASLLGRGMQAAGMIGKVSKVTSGIAKGLIGGITSRAMEGAMESSALQQEFMQMSGQQLTMEEALKIEKEYGVPVTREVDDTGTTRFFLSPEAAQEAGAKAAARNFNANMALLLTDIPQFMLAMNPYGKVTEKLTGKLAKKLGKSSKAITARNMLEYGTQMATEGFEEGYQYISAERNKDIELARMGLIDETDFNESIDKATKDGEFYTSMLFGALGAGVMQAASKGINKLINKGKLTTEDLRLQNVDKWNASMKQYSDRLRAAEANNNPLEYDAVTTEMLTDKLIEDAEVGNLGYSLERINDIANATAEEQEQFGMDSEDITHIKQKLPKIVELAARVEESYQNNLNETGNRTMASLLTKHDLLTTEYNKTYNEADKQVSNIINDTNSWSKPISDADVTAFAKAQTILNQANAKKIRLEQKKKDSLKDGVATFRTRQIETSLRVLDDFIKQQEDVVTDVKSRNPNVAKETKAAKLSNEASNNLKKAAINAVNSIVERDYHSHYSDFYRSSEGKELFKKENYKVVEKKVENTLKNAETVEALEDVKEVVKNTEFEDTVTRVEKEAVNSPVTPKKTAQTATNVVEEVEPVRGELGELDALLTGEVSTPTPVEQAQGTYKDWQEGKAFDGMSGLYQEVTAKAMVASLKQENNPLAPELEDVLDVSKKDGTLFKERWGVFMENLFTTIALGEGSTDTDVIEAANNAKKALDTINFHINQRITPKTDVKTDATPVQKADQVTSPDTNKALKVNRSNDGNMVFVGTTENGIVLNNTGVDIDIIDFNIPIGSEVYIVKRTNQGNATPEAGNVFYDIVYYTDSTKKNKKLVGAIPLAGKGKNAAQITSLRKALDAHFATSTDNIFPHPMVLSGYRGEYQYQRSATPEYNKPSEAPAKGKRGAGALQKAIDAAGGFLVGVVRGKTVGDSRRIEFPNMESIPGIPVLEANDSVTAESRRKISLSTVKEVGGNWRATYIKPHDPVKLISNNPGKEYNQLAIDTYGETIDFKSKEDALKYIQEEYDGEMAGNIFIIVPNPMKPDEALHIRAFSMTIGELAKKRKDVHKEVMTNLFTALINTTGTPAAIIKSLRELVRITRLDAIKLNNYLVESFKDDAERLQFLKGILNGDTMPDIFAQIINSADIITDASQFNTPQYDKATVLGDKPAMPYNSIIDDVIGVTTKAGRPMDNASAIVDFSSVFNQPVKPVPVPKNNPEVITKEGKTPVQGSVKENPPVVSNPTEVVKTNVPTSDIEAKKADIERRRQEELERYSGRRANSVVKFNPNGENTELTEDDIEEVEKLINAAKKNGWNTDRTFRLLSTRGFVHSVGNTTEAFKEFLSARLSGEIDNRVNGEFLNTINAKYDAELANLNNQIAPEQKQQRKADIERRRQEELKNKYGKNLELIASKNNTVIQRNGLWGLEGKDYAPQRVPTEQIFAEYDKINAKYDAEIAALAKENKPANKNIVGAEFTSQGSSVEIEVLGISGKEFLITVNKAGKIQIFSEKQSDGSYKSGDDFIPRDKIEELYNKYIPESTRTAISNWLESFVGSWAAPETEDGKNYTIAENNLNRELTEITKKDKPVTTSSETPPANKAVVASIKNKIGGKTKPKLFQSIGTEVTPNSKEELDWFRKAFPNIPIKDLQEIAGMIREVTSQGATAWGAFYNAAVYMREQFPEGTVYHEAFHVLFNLALNENERATLLAKAQGKDLIAKEEWLAEKFKEVILTGKASTIDKSIKGYITKILNKLGLFIRSVVKADVKNLEELAYRVNRGKYKKLNANTFNKSQLRLYKTVAGWGYDKAVRAVDTINRFIVTDLLPNYKSINKLDGASDAEVLTHYIKAHGNNPLSIYREMAASFEEVLNDVDSGLTQEQAANLRDLVDKMFPSDGELNLIISAIEELGNNHNMVLTVKGKANEAITAMDYYQEMSLDKETSEVYDVNFITKSNKNDASSRVKTAIRYLETGYSNEFGLPEYLDYDETYNTLLKDLEGALSTTDIMNKLTALQTVKPHYEMLYDKMEEDNAFATDMLQAFNRAKMNYYIMTEKDGKYYIFDSTRSGVVNRIKEQWSNNFYKGTTVVKSNINTGQTDINKELATKLYNEYTELAKRFSVLSKDSTELDSIANQLAAILKEMTIELSPETLLYSKKNVYEGKLTALLSGRDNSVSSILKAISEGINPYEITADSNYNTALGKIASVVKDSMPELYELSHMTVEGEKAYSHIVPTFLTNFINRFKNIVTATQLVEQYKQDPLFYSNGTFYNPILAAIDSALKQPTDKLKQDALNDIFNVGVMEGYNVGGDKIPYVKMQDYDLKMISINSYHNNGSTKKGMFRLPPLSDSGNMLIMEFDKLNYQQSMNYLLRIATGEYNRIINLGKKKKGSNTYANYDNARNASTKTGYSIMPMMNGFEQSPSDNKVKAQERIDDFFTKEVDIYYNNLVDTGIIVLDNKGNISVKDSNIDSSILLSKDARSETDRTNPKAMKLFIKEMLMNDFIARTSISLMTIGDPAFYSEKTKEETVTVNRIVDYFKRAKEIFSPKTNPDINAKFQPRDSKGNPVGKEVEVRSTYRTVYLKDEEVVAPSFDEIISFLEGELKAGRINQQKFDSLKDSYSRVNHTDAQAFITAEFYRETMIAHGLWDNRKQAAYDKLQAGLGTADDLVVMQPIKPYMFNNIFDETRNIMVPVQHKNSEYVIFKQFTDKNPKLKVLHDYMLDNNVSIANFESAVKTGLTNAVTLEEISNGTIPNVQEIPMSDRGIQMATPEHHIDNSIKEGTQMRAISFSDMNPDSEYRINGEGKSMKSGELRNAYLNLLEANLKESFNDVKDMFYENGKFNWKLVQDVLYQEAVSRGLPDDFQNAIKYNESTGRLNLPVFDPVFNEKMESLFTSIMRNRITKQTAAGAALIQASSVGLSTDLKLVFKDDGGNLVESEKTTIFDKIDAEETQALKDKGYTTEMWNTLTEEEKNHAIKCSKV